MHVHLQKKCISCYSFLGFGKTYAGGLPPCISHKIQMTGYFTVTCKTRVCMKGSLLHSKHHTALYSCKNRRVAALTRQLLEAGQRGALVGGRRRLADDREARARVLPQRPAQLVRAAQVLLAQLHQPQALGHKLLDAPHACVMCPIMHSQINKNITSFSPPHSNPSTPGRSKSAT
jgi:hypothetical protein